ncbi:ras-related protein Rab-26 isoform X3 [Rattus norvegicus]|uniref:ras-related protein Rab-26 isoform X3 n=1 Tax=Rattus norvegicus TaxID=10116 RepID=UPI001916E02A|nr:ras-related protein Rab-26 isoform X7 [Rattus norvegicus]
MSRKKTPKSKGGSVPAASTLPAAANGPRLAHPRTARPGPEAPPNGPPQSGRPSLGGTGDFYDVAFKVMLVGDSGVGKTCLLVRFKDGAFLAGTFISTVGIDFRNKVLDVDGMKVKLQIWDTAGQERFRSVTHAYYRDAHGVSSLLSVSSTVAALRHHQQRFLRQHPGLVDRNPGICPAGRGAHAVGEQGGNLGQSSPSWPHRACHGLALTKSLCLGQVDSTQERVVKREDGEKLAKEYGLPFMETSAKSGLNVDLAFTAIAKELKQRSTKAPSEPRFRLHDYVKREGRGVSCCRL